MARQARTAKLPLHQTRWPVLCSRRQNGADNAFHGVRPSVAQQRSGRWFAVWSKRLGRCRKILFAEWATRKSRSTRNSVGDRGKEGDEVA